MDAATLYMIVTLQGQYHEEAPKHFPSVAACEAYVAEYRKKLADMPITASLADYRCKRWLKVS